MPQFTTVDFADLIEWYRRQCDDSWEHRHGIRLETLDNPGWLLSVDLTGTDLEGRQMEPLREGLSAAGHPALPQWIHCSVQDNTFRGACDPSQVARLFGVFDAFRRAPGACISSPLP